jgi:hypothetical protein
MQASVTGVPRVSSKGLCPSDSPYTLSLAPLRGSTFTHRALSEVEGRRRAVREDREDDLSQSRRQAEGAEVRVRRAALRAAGGEKRSSKRIATESRATRFLDRFSPPRPAEGRPRLTPVTLQASWNARRSPLFCDLCARSSLRPPPVYYFFSNVACIITHAFGSSTTATGSMSLGNVKT